MLYLLLSQGQHVRLSQSRLKAVRDALPESDVKAGVAVIGISPDEVPQQKKFDEKHGLGFPLLSDTDHRIADAYGVWGEKKMYGKTLPGHRALGLSDR
jgi:peroxiredoxin